MKQSSSSSGCSSSGANNTFSPTSGLTSEHHHHQLPLGLDLEEVTFKGSLLERIKTLENRLFQVSTYIMDNRSLELPHIVKNWIIMLSDRMEVTCKGLEFGYIVITFCQLRLRVESDKREARARRDQLSSSLCSFPIFTMSNQGRGAYKKHVDAPNASIIIDNTESQVTGNHKLRILFICGFDQMRV